LTLILIPPMLYALMQKRMTPKLYITWIVFPIMFQLLYYGIGALIVFNFLPSKTQDLITYTKGLPLFLFNLVILGWAINEYLHNNSSQLASNKQII